ncbi:MAG: TonB-dependent receptor plug domain-containing protein [Rhodoblastus sp.]|uniref:TonB-dependent receptor plug domain-containing protein n=1 Tax=Rhodoblastus sp. TaxID=1962975 RepID=UPI003F9E1912
MIKIQGPSCGRPITFIAAILGAAAFTNIAHADDATPLPEVVVTADRITEPASAPGASVTVIPGSRVAQWGTQGITETLREAVGVEVTPTGGSGSTTTVRIRGGDPGAVLVLIDGQRVGNVAGTDGSLDFGNLTAVNIDRIEVLRGPQTALYGSDAMAGVINIITKKGTSGEPQRSVSIEGGSYGTISGRASMSGADGNWTYSLGVNAMYTNGFPQYGYRINRPITIGDGVTPLPPLPFGDPNTKGGANGNFSYKISPTASIDFGFSVFGNRLRFDNPYAFVPADVFSADNHSQAWIGSEFLRFNFATFDGALNNHLTLFNSTTLNQVNQTEGCYDASYNSFTCQTTYHGVRWGGEYQGDLSLGRYGSVSFGGRRETELASNSQSPNPDDGSFSPISAQQTTNSGFLQYRAPILPNLEATFGGRVDSIQDGSTFVTGRVTLAYRIDETGTKLHGSFGNGAKAPTLFQRYSQYGDPSLQPERSVGGDVGVDQKIFGDRMTLSATYFDTQYTNLISFADAPSCTAAQVNLGGCYYNVGRAQTQGVEVSGTAELIPSVLRARVGYTYTDAMNLETNTQLLRVPMNSGSINLVYTGIDKLEIAPRLLLVGPTLDANYAAGGTVKLASYARLDILANYKINNNLLAYTRLENVTDAKYETVYNYGTPGVSIYAGLTYTW